MIDTFLTEHFRLYEFILPSHRKNIPDEVIGNLKLLCIQVLEPVRLALERPIVVTSGWRPKKHNDKIGGSPTSDHITGNAADIAVLNDEGFTDIKATKDVFEFIRTNLFGRFGQLIYEERPKGGSLRKVWIHVSNITDKHPGAIRRDVLVSLQPDIYLPYHSSLLA